MKDGQTYVVDSLPGVVPFYAKALRRRPGFKDGDHISASRVEWPSLRFTPSAIARYSAACHWRLIDGQVPLYFPHSLFGPLHLLMLTAPEFPLRVLGALHLRNHIVQHRALYPGEEYAASLCFSAQRRRPQGLEVDFRTTISCAGTVHWQSLTTFLFRVRLHGEDAPSALASCAEPLTAAEPFASFEVPASIGKHFGRITRDINPIHMSRWLAKAFGFERDLCHGMWALARAQSCIKDIDYRSPIRSDAAFKGPMYIGRDITLKAEGSTHAHHELYSADNPRPCVIAKLRNVEPGRALDDCS